MRRLASLSRGEGGAGHEWGWPWHCPAERPVLLRRGGCNARAAGRTAPNAAGHASWPPHAGTHQGVPGDPLPAMMAPGMGSGGAMPLSAQQHAALSHILSPGSAAGSLEPAGHPWGLHRQNLRQLWPALTTKSPSSRHAPCDRMPFLITVENCLCRSTAAAA